MTDHVDQAVEAVDQAVDQAGGPVAEAVDHARLLAEIDAEVRRRRESGDLPADFERELDLVFARFAPVHAIGDDFHQVLERAEQSTFIDVLAPVESARPLVPYLKRVVRRAIAWEVRYVAQQVSAFAHALSRAVRLLGERVDALEHAAPGAGGRAAREGSAAGAAGPADVWIPTVLATMEGVPGRVLHGECGDGGLVLRLRSAGVDAYGVDPVERTGPAGPDLRVDDVVPHLRAVPDAALGGVVLSGCVDRLPLGALLDLADLAAAKVAPGGAVVVLGSDPRVWAIHRPPVEVDLAPGRPLRAETWRHLLAGRGLDPVEVVPGPAGPGLQPVPGADPALEANLARLEQVLFPPATYAVVARRPRP